MASNQEMIRIDALLPAEMARRAAEIGVKKAAMDGMTMFVLAILAGAFIALGAIFATTVAAGATGLVSYGVTRLLMGFVFSLGLILVVVGGAELFTGNNLIVMAFASGKVSLGALMRNWGIVYAGNFVGSLATALIMYYTEQYTFGGGAVGKTALTIANAKCELDFIQAIALGMMCNGLVCLAVWLTYSAHSTLDKIAAIVFPITAFVAAGFEHSVANMYFIPIGLFIKDLDGDFTRSLALSLGDLTWGNFLLNNLLPVTIGNIIGGSLMVGIVYWFVYLRAQES